MSINNQVTSPSFVYVNSYAPAETLKNSSSTENMESTTSKPLSTTYLSLNEFEYLLQNASQQDDPFIGLTQAFTKSEDHWSCFFKIDSGAHIECQIAFDTWSSTCFAKERPGLFRYIELFEHDPNTKITEDKPIVSIRITEGHNEGEWLWINRSTSIAGKQAKDLGQKLSCAMKIKQCFLADSAKVLASDGISELVLLAPLQIIQGHGYYAPLFLLHDTNKKKVETPVLISGTEEQLSVCQNPESHKRRVTWMQALKVNTIYSKILNDRPDDQKCLISILKRLNPKLKSRKAKVVIECTSDLSFQDLMTQLYKQKDNSLKNKKDYEWAYFRLLHQHALTRNSPIQNKYANIAKKLFDNMLMVAHFAK